MGDLPGIDHELRYYLPKVRLPARSSIESNWISPRDGRPSVTSRRGHFGGKNFEIQLVLARRATWTPYWCCLLFVTPCARVVCLSVTFNGGDFYCRFLPSKSSDFYCWCQQLSAVTILAPVEEEDSSLDESSTGKWHKLQFLFSWMAILSRIIHSSTTSTSGS